MRRASAVGPVSACAGPASLTVSIAVLLAALWFGLPRFADHAARLVPNEWEVDLGESLVEPVVRQLARFDGTETAAFCTASRGREVLEALSRRLAPAESPYRFHVRVVNLKMNNAFALPGGQVVIAQGFLRFAESRTRWPGSSPTRWDT